MKTMAINPIAFGNRVHSDKGHRNESKDTVTIPKNEYNKLNRLAAKGVMAMAMASAVIGTGTLATSCSKDDSVSEITQPDNPSITKPQKDLMEILGTLGVTPLTNSSNPSTITMLSGLGKNGDDYETSDDKMDDHVYMKLVYDKTKSDDNKTTYTFYASETSASDLLKYGRVEISDDNGTLVRKMYCDYAPDDVEVTKYKKSGDKVYISSSDDLPGRNEYLAIDKEEHVIRHYVEQDGKTIKCDKYV